MTKIAPRVVMALAPLALMVTSAEAQIVTSYYAPQVVAPSTSLAYAPGAVLTPAVASPIVGTLPVRRGLFGLRTEYVPVLAGAPVVAPVAGVVTAARPVVSAYSVPYPAYSLPYASARPVITTAPAINSVPMYTSGTALSVVNPTLPSAVVQSGYRGFVPMGPVNPAPVIVTPAPSYPFNAGPYNSFYPGAVMTMQ
jgi:hypothetical protein